MEEWRFSRGPATSPSQGSAPSFPEFFGGLPTYAVPFDLD